MNWTTVSKGRGVPLCSDTPLMEAFNNIALEIGDNTLSAVA